MAIKGKEVLIVEDDPQQREFYSTVLENTGIKVHLFEEATQAIDKLRNFIPHAVIIDINLFNSESNGLKVLHFIRSQDSLSNIPAIVISSESKKGVIYKALAIGATDYQIKPISARGLIQRLRRLFLDYESVDLNFINEFTGDFDAEFSEKFQGNFEVELEVPAQIHAINELNCLIKSPVKFREGDSISADAPLAKEVGEDKFLLRAYADGKSTETGIFTTRFSLVAVDEGAAQILRTLRGTKK